MIEELSYGKELWDKFDLVSKVAGDKLKYSEEFIRIMQERSTIEEQYAKSMERLQGTIPGAQKNSLIDAFLVVLRENFRERINAARQLSMALKNEVAELFSKVIKIHTPELKRLNQEGRRLEKEIKSVQERVVDSKQKYVKAAKEVDFSSISSECSLMNSEFTPAKKQSLQAKYGSMKEFEDSEKDHQLCIADYNQYIEKYTKEIKDVLDSIQKNERDSLDIYKESLLKLALVEAASIQTIDAMVTRTKQSLTPLDPLKEMKDFATTNRTTRDCYHTSAIEPYSSFNYTALERTLESDKPISAEAKAQEAIIEAYKIYYEHLVDLKPLGNLADYIKPGEATLSPSDEARLVRIATIVDIAWNGERDLSKEELEEFDSLMADDSDLGKKAWTSSFQQYRISGKFHLADQGFNNMVFLLKIVLNRCLATRDSSTAKKLMVLALTFYNVEGGLVPGQPASSNDKVFLHQAILDHPIWKRNDFWESAIVESIKEEFALQRGYNLDQTDNHEENILREKNVVFGQLGTFAFNMLMFEYDCQEVKNIISKFCKYFNLPDIFIKELMGNIESSHKTVGKKIIPPEVLNAGMLVEASKKKVNFLALIRAQRKANDIDEKVKQTSSAPKFSGNFIAKEEGLIDPLTAPLVMRATPSLKSSGTLASKTPPP